MGNTEFTDSLLGADGFYPYMLRQMKEHRKDLDISNPRDFLDVLMIEADTNPSMGYSTIAQTMIGLYLGASDTLSNTLRWLVLTLAEYQDVQEKCLIEIQECEKAHGEILKEHCPYLRNGIGTI